MLLFFLFKYLPLKFVRHRVISALGHRTAAQNTPNSKTQTDKGSAFIKRFNGIGGAAWLKPTARGFERRNKLLIKFNQKNKDILHNIEGGTLQP